MKKITKEEFLSQFTRNSKMLESELLRRMNIVPCDCDYLGCRGWKTEMKETKKPNEQTSK